MEIKNNQNNCEVSDTPCFFTIEHTGKQKMPKYNTTGDSYRLKFKNMEHACDVYEALHEAFETVVNIMKKDAQPNDLVGFYLNQPSIMETPITLPYCRAHEINADSILHYIERVLQSHQELVFDDDLLIKFIKVSPPSGTGARRTFHGNLEKRLEKMHCLVRIKNQDTLCCARALVVAKAIVDEDVHVNAIKFPIPRAKNTIQATRAAQLMSDAGLPEHTGACEITELQKLQEVLTPQYQIKVWCQEKFDSITFMGQKAGKVLHLYLHANHYDVITSITAFFNKIYWCETCNKGYDHRVDHKCTDRCDRCLAEPACTKVDVTYCKDCNIYFTSSKCFTNRKQKTKKQKYSICDKVKRCNECNNITNAYKRKHLCGQYTCFICKENVKTNEPYQCFMKNIPKKSIKPSKYIFFDIETRQDNP